MKTPWTFLMELHKIESAKKHRIYEIESKKVRIFHYGKKDCK